jgi:hypothetical protein
MADATFKGGNSGCTRVLRLGGIGIGGIEGADLGPYVVVAYEQAICIYVEDGGDGVATQLAVESGYFYGVDKLLECVGRLFLEVLGEVLME